MKYSLLAFVALLFICDPVWSEEGQSEVDSAAEAQDLARVLGGVPAQAIDKDGPSWEVAFPNLNSCTSDVVYHVNVDRQRLSVTKASGEGAGKKIGDFLEKAEQGEKKSQQILATLTMLMNVVAAWSEGKFNRSIEEFHARMEAICAR